MPPPSYEWINFVTGRQQLSARLYDEHQVWTTDTEAGVYIQWALRIFNALTNTWKTDFVFNPSTLWNFLGNLYMSPRNRTLTDTACYTLMEYMLVEPPSGATWTGTPQFAISDLATALQKRRDEMILVSNCNQQIMPNIPLMVGTRRTVLPDTVLEVARVRYLPGQAATPSSGFGQGGFGSGGFGGVATPGLSYGAGYGSGGFGQGGFGTGQGPIPGVTAPVTLYRDDHVANEFYQDGFLQVSQGTPQTFMLTSEPPLTWDVDIPPNLPGTYEAIALQAGQPFNPPGGILLNIPDDFAWVAIWGAMSDLVGRESEAVDRQRADFCMKRWLDGLNLFLKTPWIMLANIAGVAVDTQSIYAADRYSPEWDSSPDNIPFIVTGGIDFFACQQNTSIGLTLLGNAPIPSADGDFIQVSPANWVTVLDLAQALACFKLGGEEFQAALELEARAVQACAAENTRLKSTGSFADILIQRGQAQEIDQARYNTANPRPAAAQRRSR